MLKNSLYDHNCTENIIRENYDAIYKYCYYHVRNSHIAQDITQDVFMKFLINIEKYIECGKLKNYLYVVAKNTINDYMRKPKEISLEDNIEKKAERETESMTQINNRIMVETALDKLEHMQKEIIILKYYQDLRLKDIAKIVSLPVSTVRYKLKQAEKELKKEMESEE